MVEYAGKDGAPMEMATLTATFAALGDPVRQRMVELLADGDRTVSELAARFPISVQAVSKHIKVLEHAGVVSRGRAAQTRPVHLEAASLAGTADWLEAHRRRLETRYERLDALLDERRATT
jgi:DNA-binding transcriptional ArsR family regulator